MREQRFKTAVILAGGQSRRMGYDKFNIEIGGSSLLDDLAGTLGQMFDQVLVSANSEDIRRPEGTVLVHDEIGPKGPLSGLHAALQMAGGDYVYVCACDMPAISLDYIHWLSTQIGRHPVDVCCCRHNGSIQPFHAFYNRRIVPLLAARLNSGQLRMRDLLESLDCHLADSQELPARICPDDLFANINTPEDLDRFRKINLEAGSVPAISIMGWSGSGKTTLIEKLIPILQARGLRIGVLKHDGHRFDMDRKGKDTWRYGQAGARVAAIASAYQAAFLEYRQLDLMDMLVRFRDVDLVLVEGYKETALPRIEVHRMANNKPLALQPENLAAIVTDAPASFDRPTFGLDDAGDLADFILASLI